MEQNEPGEQPGQQVRQHRENRLVDRVARHLQSGEPHCHVAGADAAHERDGAQQDAPPQTALDVERRSRLDARSSRCQGKLHGQLRNRDDHQRRQQEPQPRPVLVGHDRSEDDASRERDREPRRGHERRPSDVRRDRACAAVDHHVTQRAPVDVLVHERPAEHEPGIDDARGGRSVDRHRRPVGIDRRHPTRLRQERQRIAVLAEAEHGPVRAGPPVPVERHAAHEETRGGGERVHRGGSLAFPQSSARHGRRQAVGCEHADHAGDERIRPGGDDGLGLGAQLLGEQAHCSDLGVVGPAHRGPRRLGVGELALAGSFEDVLGSDSEQPLDALDERRRRNVPEGVRCGDRVALAVDRESRRQRRARRRYRRTGQRQDPRERPHPRRRVDDGALHVGNRGGLRGESHHALGRRHRNWPQEVAEGLSGVHRRSRDKLLVRVESHLLEHAAEPRPDDPAVPVGGLTRREQRRCVHGHDRRPPQQLAVVADRGQEQRRLARTHEQRAVHAEALRRRDVRRARHSRTSSE